MRSPTVSPVTVSAPSRTTPPRRAASFSTAGTPPARWMSSMCTVESDGAIFAMCATFVAMASIARRSNATPASRAMASMWRTVFEDPPIAMSTTMALWMLSAFTIRRIRNRSSPAISTARRAARRTSASRSGVSARAVPFPGSAIPIASHSTFMEFAVNIPEQEPPEGQARHSIS